MLVVPLKAERIRFVAQLQEGDTILVANCRVCGRHHEHELGPSPSFGTFFTSGTFHSSTTGHVNLIAAVQEGRVYRAPKNTPAEDSLKGGVPT